MHRYRLAFAILPFLASPAHAQCTETSAPGALACGTGSSAARDGVAVGQQATAPGEKSVALGTRATANGASSTAQGVDSLTSGPFGVAVGAESRAADSATGIGSYASSTGDGSVSIGFRSIASDYTSVALGRSAMSTGRSGVALGSFASAANFDTVSVGTYSQATGWQATALGAHARAAGENGLALGLFSAADHLNSVAIGIRATTSRANQIMLGTRDHLLTLPGLTSAASLAAQTGPTYLVTTDAAGNLATTDLLGQTRAELVAARNTIDSSTASLSAMNSRLDTFGAQALLYDDPSRSILTLGAAGGPPVTIARVAPGVVSAGSDQAVNGAQLFDVTSALATHASDLTVQQAALAAQAGELANQRANLAAQDAVIADQQTDLLAQRTSITTNSTAIDEAAMRITANASDIGQVRSDLATLRADLGAGGTGLVRQDTTIGVISIAGGQEGTLVDLAGRSGARRTTGVASGAVATGSTDAVNGSQLHAVGEQLTAHNTAIAGNAAAIAAQAATLNATRLSLANLSSSIRSGAGARTATGVVPGADVSFDGSRVTGVAAGILSATSSDAVNGAQLFATNRQLATAGQTLADLRTQVDDGTIGVVRQDRAAGDRITIAATRGGNVVDVSGSAGDRVLSGVAAGNRPTDAVNVEQLDAAISDVSARTVAYDDASRGSITLNLGSAEVRLGNLAAGAVAAGSADAVNGAQLHATEQRVEAAVQQIAELNDGTAGALRTRNDGNLASASATGADAVAGGYGAQASGEKATAIGADARASGEGSVALGAGSTDDGRAGVLSAGRTGAERQVVNVAAGTRPTDVVNLSQLQQQAIDILSMSKTYTDTRVDALAFDLRRTRRDMAAGTAAAMAIASLPQAFEPGRGLIAGSVATYRDQTAFAFGGSKTFEGRAVVKVSGTVDGRGTAGGSVGVGYQF